MATIPTQMRLTERDLAVIDEIKEKMHFENRTEVVRVATLAMLAIVKPEKKKKKSLVAT